MDNAESLRLPQARAVQDSDFNTWTNFTRMFSISEFTAWRIVRISDVESVLKIWLTVTRSRASPIGTTNKIFNDDYYNYYATWTKIYLIPNQAVQVNYVDEQGTACGYDIDRNERC